MRRETFYAGRNRSGNLLHIETDGAIVNIQVGLHGKDGNPVTVISVLPEDETRSPDLDGHYWHTEDADGNDTRGAHVRVVRQPRARQASGQISSVPAASVTGYPYDGYDGTDESFAALQAAGHAHCSATGHPDPGEGDPAMAHDHCGVAGHTDPGEETQAAGPGAVFGRSQAPKRQSRAFEDRVIALMQAGYTQDQALEMATAEDPTMGGETP